MESVLHGENSSMFALSLSITTVMYGVLVSASRLIALYRIFSILHGDITMLSFRCRAYRQKLSRESVLSLITFIDLPGFDIHR